MKKLFQRVCKFLTSKRRVAPWSVAFERKLPLEEIERLIDSGMPADDVMRAGWKITVVDSNTGLPIKKAVTN